MNIVRTEIEDILVIEPRVFGDHRGWFTETYSKEKFNELGVHIDFIPVSYTHLTLPTKRIV